MPTRKPCPGCQDDRFDKWRKAGELCHDCKGKIRFANQVLGNRENDACKIVYTYQVPSKRATGAMKFEAPLYGKPEERIKACLLNLAREFSEIVSPNLDSPPSAAQPPYHWSLFKRDYSFDFRNEVLAFTEERAELLRGLALAIEEACKEAFAAGERNGQAFISQLAAGKISIENLNEKMEKSK